ncbi:hypothetical protein LCGC14_1381470 [marine sediment metagenome]|uniref:Uncharacterized protein n=1 Tax=marine sediment metagenome TaxID=412755 RepID=A0A0F9K2M4_9ZZZZ
MPEKYEVTKEAILAMAEKSPEAKEMLKAGFPEAFEEDKHFDLTKLKDKRYIFTDEEAKRAGFRDQAFMNVRVDGEYRGIAFYLQEAGLKWTLVRDKTTLSA